MTALEKLLKDVIHLFEKSGKAREELEEATKRVAACRSRGLRLIEAEGNPDPLLERGRGEHAQALEALQRAEAKAARRHLDAVFDQVKNVGEVIDRQEKAKAECGKELPARRATAERLRKETAEAQAHRTELEQQALLRNRGARWRIMRIALVSFSRRRTPAPRRRPPRRAMGSSSTSGPFPFWSRCGGSRSRPENCCPRSSDACVS